MTHRLLLMAVLAAAALFLLVASAKGQAPAKPGAGYAPLTAKAESRVLIRVLDTESSLGPLAKTPREVRLGDLVRFHGHPCDGLVAAADGIALGLKSLFPDGIVDRTDVAAATNASPCYSDVAAYMTGARTIYGTLVIDKALGDEWILERLSSRRAVRVRLVAGVKPATLPGLEKKLRAEGCDKPLIAQVQSLQLAFIHGLLASPRESLYTLEVLSAFPYAVSGERPDAAKARCK